MRAALIAIAACVPAIDVAKRSDPSVTTAPAIDLATHDGQRFVLGDALAQHDVLLVFYRGHW